MLESTLRSAGAEPSFFLISPAQPINELCQRAARQMKEAGGVVVAAGGDGTVNAVAAACRELQVPLAVVPLGTFNYFARAHGIPLDIAEAARLVMTGAARPVSAGDVNGRLFLNNASFGLYTHLIQQREQAKARFGRYRLVAMLSGMVALMRGQPPFAVRLVSGEAATVQRTSMIFVANNALQLKDLELDAAACTREGMLGVLLLRPTKWLERLRLLLRSALKDLDRDQRLETFCTEGFEVESTRRAIDLVVDGEIIRLHPPLKFRALPEALRLVAPPAAAV